LELQAEFHPDRRSALNGTGIPKKPESPGSSEHDPLHYLPIEKFCRLKTAFRGHPEGNFINVNKLVAH